MTNYVKAYCSWCFENTRHVLIQKNLLQRNEYECEKCKNITVKCRVPNCSNMARGHGKHNENINFGIKEWTRQHWNNELCAEHDGSIASFDKLAFRINYLEDYRLIFNRDKWNIKKGATIAAGVVAGTIIFGITAGTAAPGIASALGSVGLLGTASTGTAISTLSGASLTNASLAAIGGGAVSAGGLGMAGGTIFISAAGAALGATQGGVISNNYIGNIKDFRITKVKEGVGPAVIFINGFLSQKNQDSSDWEKGVYKKFPSNPYYYVTWESKTNYDLGKMAIKGVGAVAFKNFAQKLAANASRKALSKINPLNWVATINEVISNPWHTAMVKAAMTGILLADLLPRVKTNNGFILVGHSLGSRVIYYALEALSTKKEKYIKDVYLFGGAVARTTEHDWKTAYQAVEGSIHNFYCRNDLVLKYLYQIATVWTSPPIGLDTISYQCDGIYNYDVSNMVNGHMEYKNNLNVLLNHIK